MIIEIILTNYLNVIKNCRNKHELWINLVQKCHVKT
jgi:hypothetical protein